MNNMNVNKSGYATDCHFFKQTDNIIQCSALKDFYNDISDADPSNCLGCPFFKTRKQYEEGKAIATARLKAIRKEKAYNELLKR